MDGLHKWFLETNIALENNKKKTGLSPEEFWNIQISVFNGDITPEKGAEILSNIMLNHLQKNITKKLLEEIG